METHRYFIFDCDDNVIGNPKGYATARGASRQANSRKLQPVIWQRFYNRQNQDRVRVWEIHCFPVVKVIDGKKPGRETAHA